MFTCCCRFHRNTRLVRWSGTSKAKARSALPVSMASGSAGLWGQSFWGRGYFVSTVGRDETVVREYIKNQENEDQKLEQLNLWRQPATFRWPINRGRTS